MICTLKKLIKPFIYSLLLLPASEAKAQADISRRMLADVGGLDETELKSALHRADVSRPVAKTPAPPTALRQDIRFCTASDGVRIAYATVGSGPPLVKTANWMNHLEFDWESPIWRHVFHALSSDRTFIRYDSRGNRIDAQGRLISPHTTTP